MQQQITTSCLISEFQMSGRTSETLDRGSWYPARGLSLDFKASLQILGRCSWIRYLISRTSTKDLRTSLQIQSQSLGQIWRSSAESFRCAAGHLRFNYQTRCSNLLIYIDNTNFLPRCQFKGQIWWNPRLDTWSQEPRARIWGLVYKSRFKPSAGYKDPRPKI